MTNDKDTYREFRHGLELLNTKLDLVQHTTIEHSREHQVVRALLAVKASYKQTRIILSGKKFKRGGVVKGMNVVLSGKVDGMRSLERVLQWNTLSMKSKILTSTQTLTRSFMTFRTLSLEF